MPSVGPTEILLVLVIALLVLGPKRLPEMARQLGRGIRQFREAARNVTREMGAEDLVNDLKDLNQARGSFGETVRKELGLDELGEFPNLSDVGEPESTAPTDAAVFTEAVGASPATAPLEALATGPAADVTAAAAPRPARKRTPRAKPETAEAIPAPAAPAAPKVAPRTRRTPARTAKTTPEVTPVVPAPAAPATPKAAPRTRRAPARTAKTRPSEPA